jgi:hypothetical protein
LCERAILHDDLAEPFMRGDQSARKAVYANRMRLRPDIGRETLRRRGELVERSLLISFNVWQTREFRIAERRYILVSASMYSSEYDDRCGRKGYRALPWTIYRLGHFPLAGARRGWDCAFTDVVLKSVQRVSRLLDHAAPKTELLTASSFLLITT